MPTYTCLCCDHTETFESTDAALNGGWDVAHKAGMDVLRATTENDFAAKRKLREYREHADQNMLQKAPDEITRLRAESTAKTAHQYTDMWLDINAQRVELALFEYRTRHDSDVDFKAARQLADDVAASIHADCLEAVEAHGTALTKPKPTESSEAPAMPADSPNPAHR